jgi:Flp pilus assembly protein TadB
VLLVLPLAAVCCGGPLLAGLAATSVAGLWRDAGTAAAAAVAAAVGLGAWAWRRRSRRAAAVPK